MVFLQVLVVFGTIFLGFCLYLYFQERNRIFKRLGIPGPNPVAILGNFTNPFSPIPFQLQAWTKQFGKTFGYFEGATPVIVTSDLDMVQEIYVKRFPIFHGRKPFPMQSDDQEKDPFSNVFLSKGMKWKRLRTLSNPAFSMAKLKSIMPTMEDSIKVLVKRLDDSDEQNIDIYPYFQEMAIDIIGRVAFGQQKTLQGQDNTYLDIAKNIFTIRTFAMRFYNGVAVMLPELKNFMRMLNRTRIRSGPHMLFRMLKRVIKERKKNRGRYQELKDFINMFLDAEVDDIRQIKASDGRDDEKGGTGGLKVHKKLTTDEIVAQCFIFMLAGYDTTSNSLAYLSHLLATHPEVQEKIYNEIEEHWGFEDDLTYDMMAKMKYIDCVIKEALRLYPLASFINTRVATTTTVINGLLIPEGMSVAVDVWSIHYSKEVWGPDADQFKPERWENGAGERHPAAWMPFGLGPRICIGMRLAQLEEKMTLCHIMRQFEFCKSDQTQIPLKLQGVATINPERVDVIMKRR